MAAPTARESLPRKPDAKPIYLSVDEPLDALLVPVWQVASRISLPRLCALQHDRTALAEAYGELA